MFVEKVKRERGRRQGALNWHSRRSSATLAKSPGLTEPLFFPLFLCVCRPACEILVPPPGIEPRPHQRKRQVLTTGLPGNSPFFFYFIFFYFWLPWVFVAARGLSLVAASGHYSLLRCVGFSLRWLLLLWSTGSRCAGFCSCSMRAQ